tara:strand:+ start:20 stop:469 length:450 start_codon:yes stop_codon:yes gene_type:complete
MQINTLYLPINTITPNRKTAETPDSVEKVTAQVTKDIEYKLSRLLRNNTVLIEQIEKTLANEIIYADALEYRSLRCGLLLSIKHLCKARGHGKWKGIETWMFHINTFWLRLNRLVHGDHVVYKDAQNVAYRDNWIPLKQRFYGKRKRAK